MAAALGCALSAAVSSVLQHRSARQAPAGRGLQLGLIAHLFGRPLWLAGLLAAGFGVGLHALALSVGKLAVVQPLLVTGLLFALPVSVLLERRRPSLVEWCWAVVLVGGLALFLSAARPGGGQVPSDTDRLILVVISATVVAGGLVVLGFRSARRHRAALLGLAGGIAYGVTAALIKNVTELAAHPVDVLLTWPVYALIAVGVAALVLSQAGYQAGPIAASLPPLTMADLVVAILSGVLAFHERLAYSPTAIVLEVVSFLLISVATLQLARRTAADLLTPNEQPGVRRGASFETTSRAGRRVP